MHKLYRFTTVWGRKFVRKSQGIRSTCLTCCHYSVPSTCASGVEVDWDVVVSMHEVMIPSTVFSSSTVVVLDSSTVPPSLVVVFTVWMVSTTLWLVTMSLSPDPVSLQCTEAVSYLSDWIKGLQKKKEQKLTNSIHHIKYVTVRCNLYTLCQKVGSRICQEYIFSVSRHDSNVVDNTSSLGCHCSRETALRGK